MTSGKLDLERQDMVPFLLRLFYRTTSPHNTTEFLSQSSLPDHLTIYTWTNCTLRELSSHLFAAPSALSSPALGSRLVFRLVYPDAKAVANANAPANFITRDIGSVVVGHDRRGVADYDTIMNGEEDIYDYINNNGDSGRDLGGSNEKENVETATNTDMDMDIDTNAEVEARLGGGGLGSGAAAVVDDGKVTLQDAKFVIGDYVTVTILPPDADGSVPDAPSRPPISRPAPRTMFDSRPPPKMGGGGMFDTPFGFNDSGPLGRRGGGRRGGRGGNLGGGGGGGGGNGGGGGGRIAFSGSNTIPLGEWRRGERIPEQPRGGGGRRGKRW